MAARSQDFPSCMLARGQIFALSQKQIQFPRQQQIWLVESIESAGHARGCCCLVTRLPNDFAELVSQLYKLLEISTKERSQDITDKAKKSKFYCTGQNVAMHNQSPDAVVGENKQKELNFVFILQAGLKYVWNLYSSTNVIFLFKNSSFKILT